MQQPVVSSGLGRHPAFVEAQHPRDHGKFAHVAGSQGVHKKPTVGRGQATSIAKQVGKLHGEAKSNAEIQKAREELQRTLSNSQKARLQSVLASHHNNITPVDKSVNSTLHSHPIGPKEQHSSLIGPVERHANPIGPEDKHKAPIGPEPQQPPSKPPRQKKVAPVNPAVATPEQVAVADATKAAIKASAPTLAPPDILYEKLGKAPTPRPPSKIDSFQVDANGTSKLWEGSKHAQHDPSWSFEHHDYEYSVSHEGNKLVLNDHKTRATYGGDTVYGVPEQHKDLSSLTDKKLFSVLAANAAYVENSKSVAVPSPEWNAKQHGQEDKKHLLPPNGKYGKQQVHHVDQWAAVPFQKVNNDLETGKITLEEAKAQYGTLLQKRQDGRGWEIKVPEAKDRAYVVLAGGLHDSTSPLYYANHPKGINPDTGKSEKFGISQEKGSDTDRDVFAKWRNGFWTEYYRRDALNVHAEINSRLASGKLKPEDAKSLWENAHKSVDNSHKHLLYLKHEHETKKAAQKAAIAQAKADGTYVEPKKTKKTPTT